MSDSQLRKVAIIGAGPAGASCAAYLAREGVEVTLFSRPARPAVLVGESLVPAVIPFLRELGIEEEVASYSVYKPGATFVLDPEALIRFTFSEVRGGKLDYAYNTPRDLFDRSILDAALKSGVRLVEEAARVERVGDTDRVRLTAETQAIFGADEPDFIIDASGRNRLLSRVLDIPSTEGARRDTALHAHMEGTTLIEPSDVHTDRLGHGWSWRIPLPGRVSVGIVVDGATLRKFGDSPEEQFDNFLAKDPMIQTWGEVGKRITPVVKYNNYQLCTDRGHGDGWALLGDSFGFVDPVFSSGLLIGMDGARELARALMDGSPGSMKRWDAHVQRQLRAWHKIVGWYYDGRLLTLFRVGGYVRNTWLGWLVDFHLRKHMPRIFTGEGTTRPYSLGLLEFMIEHGLAGNDPKILEVR